MKRFLLLIILFISYVIIVLPLTNRLKEKTIVEKLGYVPDARILKVLSGDQKILVADLLVMKTLFYFGGVMEHADTALSEPADYFTIYKSLETAVKIDPYDIDAYYFAQAVLVWEVGRINEANALLEYGMKYRSWDYYLPFFAGFNNAYFLKDYRKAAVYYKRAAELSGDPLFIGLAGRYYYESGQTEIAIAYLSSIEKGMRNDAVKKNLQTRIKAFKEVQKIESAIVGYKRKTKKMPTSLDQLVIAGFLGHQPVDPYGGSFYIDNQGEVKTTSKFAFPQEKKSGQKR